MAIDISSPSAYEREATGVGSVRSLLANIGRIEQSRQDRQILDRFITAKAANPEMSDISIIAGLTEAGPEFDPGLQGIFQRISSGLPEGRGTVLPQLQAGQIQTPSQRTQKVTPPRVQRDSYMEFLESGEGNEAQKEEARDGLKALPPGTLIEIEPGKLDEQFKEFMEAAEDKRIVRKKRILGFSDEVYGEEAFNAALEEAINEGLKDGIEPASMEAAFREWWDRQAEKEKGQDFQKFVATSEFGEPKGRELDATTAAAILQEAGGDKEKARKIAKDRGFKF